MHIETKTKDKIMKNTETKKDNGQRQVDAPVICTPDAKIKALKWFLGIGALKRSELFIKHHDLDYLKKEDAIVYIWRRTTCGELRGI